MFNQSYIGKYCKILYNNTIIAAGQIIDQKTTIDGVISMQLISFDYKYFFKIDGNKNKYIVDITDKFIKNIIFNKDNYQLNIEHWHNAIDTYMNDIDIYVENTYDEIDIEIKPLCDVLNKINGITTISSCCGHNEQNAFINIKFNTLDSMLYLLKILSLDVFRLNFILSSDKTIIYTDLADKPILKLKTIKIGDLAYQDINRLYEFLNIDLNL